MRENHYANPCSTESVLRFQVTRLSITLLIFPKCSGLTAVNPITKLVFFSQSKDIYILELSSKERKRIELKITNTP